jgi:hypothetical protein
MKRARTWRSRAALFAAGLGGGVVLVGVLELAVRFSCPWIPLQEIDKRLFAKASEKTGFEWMPGARGLAHGVEVEIDEAGCRAMDGPSAYDEAWLILGDSVAFGIGVPVEQTFAGLAQSAHPDVKLWNAAVVGMYATGYPEAARRMFAVDPKIRRVTLFYCLNDIPYGTPWSSGGVEAVLGTLNQTFRTRSKLYRLIAGLAGHGVVQYFLGDYARYRNIEERAEQVFAPIAEAAAIAAHNGAAFEVILMPYEPQLRAQNPEYWSPQESVNAYLVARGITVRDARTWFGDDPAGAHRYYLFGDPLHFNARGHDTVYRKWLADAPAS